MAARLAESETAQKGERKRGRQMGTNSAGMEEVEGKMKMKMAIVNVISHVLYPFYNVCLPFGCSFCHFTCTEEHLDKTIAQSSRKAIPVFVIDTYVQGIPFLTVDGFIFHACLSFGPRLPRSAAARREKEPFQVAASGGRRREKMSASHIEYCQNKSPHGNASRERGARSAQQNETY